jgi:hypothetical protein
VVENLIRALGEKVEDEKSITDLIITDDYSQRRHARRQSLQQDFSSSE